MCPAVRVNHVFEISPTSFELGDVTITPACPDTGVSVRLVSHEMRQGQVATLYSLIHTLCHTACSFH